MRPEDFACPRIQRYDIAPLRAALAQGKGAIVFHYHMGPIQYVPLLLSALGFKVTSTPLRAIIQKAIDKQRHRVRRLHPIALRIVTVPIVQQQDCARTASLDSPFGDRLLAALRQQFGGHAVKKRDG